MTHEMCSSPLQRLAAKWRVIGLIAVAFARLMRRYEDGHVHGAAAQAAQLCVCLRAAHVMIEEEIAQTLGAHPPQTDDDAQALHHVRAISIALLALHWVMLRVLPGLCGDTGWARVRGGFAMSALAAPAAQPEGGLPLLDPG